ncbi:MAG: hypothetical protein L0H83_01530 [Salinisphaera sp.]|nr:hypothetical protein [Nevskiaceae bacterium]MDN5937321.1 hypothetical protein [Salinisphaera sp.]
MLRAIIVTVGLAVAVSGVARPGAEMSAMSAGYSACTSKAAHDELMDAIRRGDELAAHRVQSRECHLFPNCELVEVLRHDGAIVQVKVGYSDYPVWVTDQALRDTCP